MEDELQCPVCLKLFDDPVILGCTHTVCFKCAENLITKNGNTLNDVPAQFTNNVGIRKSMDSDKISLQSDAVLSDSDSGYFGGPGCGNVNGSDGNNSPISGSTLSTFQPLPNETNNVNNGVLAKGVNLPVLPDSVKCLTCPICHRTIFLDERGAEGLTRHTLMKGIVNRFSRSFTNKAPYIKTSLAKSDVHQSAVRQSISAPNIITSTNALPISRNGGGLESVEPCQLCVKIPADAAVVKCLQCSVSYCAQCRENCHPLRGPLAKHNLINLPGITRSDTVQTLESEKPLVYRQNKFPPLPNKPTAKNGLKLVACGQHSTEKTSLYCETCKVSLCVQCQNEGRHKSHNVKPIGALFKQQKSDLSCQMSALSNKARQAKELVMFLRSSQNQIEKSAVNLEDKTVAQCNHLIEAVERKRDELIQKITKEKESKCKIVREQLQQSTMKLKQTTGLLEYCIEVVKDNDAAAFLQISQSLIERVSLMEKQWNQRSLHPRVGCEFDMDFEVENLIMSIDQINFIHTKVPEKPVIKVRNGTTSNGSGATLVWMFPNNSQPTDGYVLEMDNGCNGPFKKVYSGSETICTVDGLHSNCVYKARVCAYNKAGPGPFSELLYLQTSEATKFEMDTQSNDLEVDISNTNVITCKSNEHRTILGNMGFSRGIHYWEFTIDNIGKRPGPAFGIALADVDKRQILGRDNHGWSLYGPDETSLWFLNNDHHLHRCDMTLHNGSKIGILADLNKQCVIFYIDGKIINPPFYLSITNVTELQQEQLTFYPAMSLNNTTQVQLHTGVRVPVSEINCSKVRSVSNGGICQSGSLYSLDSSKLKSTTPKLKSFSSVSEKPSRGSTPPPPPIRRSSSSGSIIAKKDGEAVSTAGSDPLPIKYTDRSTPSKLTSFFQRKT